MEEHTVEKPVRSRELIKHTIEIINAGEENLKYLILNDPKKLMMHDREDWTILHEIGERASDPMKLILLNYEWICSLKTKSGLTVESVIKNNGSKDVKEEAAKILRK